MDVDLKGISKSFGQVRANQDIDLAIRQGEVLGLLGENGAGKSTLMNVLCGLCRPDSGQILVNGTPVEFHGPADSIANGIGMVHQHFMLVPVLSVVENIVLGIEPVGRAGHLDLDQARERMRVLGGRYGMHVPPDAIVEDLPVGLQQRVEILKVLFRSAEVLIFDEPTAVLTPQQVDEFFAIVRALRDSGKAIVFITHKLHEIMRIADRVSVLARGRIAGEGKPRRFGADGLARLMVGRAVSFTVNRTAPRPGGRVLEARGVNLYDRFGEQKLFDVSLGVRAGEIVGIAGVQGNGQSELAEALTGLRRTGAGTIHLGGNDITGASVRERHRLGVAHIPEDRQKSGMVASFSVAENMALNSYYDRSRSNALEVDWERVRDRAARSCIDYDVRTPSLHLAAAGLSGGNQQKMVVARELERDVRLVVACQPTRGVDVGSIEYIHRRLLDCRDGGGAVLIISSELDEIMDLCDRILVMCDGRITAAFDNARGEAKRADIGLAMAGAKRGRAA